jgi:uncharacterized protein (DUF3820 family)
MRMAFLKYHRISIDLSENQLLEMLANFDYGWFSEPTESPRGYIHKCMQIDHTLDPQGSVYLLYPSISPSISSISQRYIYLSIK